jgi:hypothetical protein
MWGSALFKLATPATIIATARHMAARVAVRRPVLRGGVPGEVSDTVSTTSLFGGIMKSEILGNLAP